jgi:predicted metal-dependent phosphoesterase TrpH
MLPLAMHFPPLALYAETHFRAFGILPSLLFRKKPEVVFDLPRRCGPGKNLPVMLIMNDIDRFPARAIAVTVVVSHKEKKPEVVRFESPDSFLVKHPLDKQANVYVFTVSRDILGPGASFINCKAELSNGTLKWNVLNDNFHGSSKLPFSCFVSDEPLPANEACSYGDLHIHSQYSQSFVEFGPPVSVIDLMADTCGIDFFSITDHSYDLSCCLTDYRTTDDQVSRWKSLSYDNFSASQSQCILIPGEEVSCYNSKRKTIHLCGIGLKDFIPGSSDGARRKPLSTLKLQEVVQNIHDQGGLAVAAHPGSKFGLFQRIILNRGSWLENDLAGQIDAVQAVNNGFGISWGVSKSLWIRELLKGHRLPLVAGNDSHGDFNRYRYISVPFVSMAENFNRYLSYCKTGIYSKVKSREDVLAQIKRGATFVTNGPFVCLSSSESIDNNLVSNEGLSSTHESITAIIKSTYEFGTPCFLQVFAGRLGNRKESLVFTEGYKEKSFSIFTKIPLEKIKFPGYIRAEVTCRTENGAETFAATSPCYLDRQESPLRRRFEVPVEGGI